MKRYTLYLSAVILCLTQIWLSCSFKQHNDWFDGYALIPEVNDIPYDLEVSYKERVKVSRPIQEYIDSLLVNVVFLGEDSLWSANCHFKLYFTPIGFVQMTEILA